MAVTTDSDRERASDEAAEWLVLLREAPGDPAIEARFAAWRAAAPVHEAAWAEMSEAFDLIGEPLARQPHATTGAVSRKRFAPGLFAGGAALALAAFVTVFFLPGWMLRLEADIATAAGEWREVRLADGSFVDLAPLSGIEVSLAPGRREVRLVAGQAFFRVTPDPARPFQVEARNLRATVLGTEFEVRLDGTGATAVAVAEGRVRVDHGTVSQVLTAGRWLRVDRAGGGLSNGIRSDGEIGLWRRGELVAHDQTIADVVNEMRPYFSGAIVIASDAVAKRRVTGVYQLREPVEALRALGRAYEEISVTRVLPWLVVVSAN